MKKLPFIFLIACGLLAFTLVKKKRVMFFGDSITEAGVAKGGYVRRIDSMCNKENRNDQYEFAGTGIGGNKIYDLYLRANDDVLAKDPDIVIIYVGVNDIWHKFLYGTGTDADKFEKFYYALLKKFSDGNIKTIICTPAVIGEKTDFSNVQDGDLNKYSAIIRDIAAKNNSPLVDLRKKFIEYNLKNNLDNRDRGILTSDGVHLNGVGNQLVAEAIWQAIKELR